MQMQTFKRTADGVRARVVTTGFLTHEVDLWNRGGYVFTDEECGCEPRAAAAEALAVYDEMRGIHVSRPGSLVDFELVEQPAR